MDLFGRRSRFGMDPSVWQVHIAQEKNLSIILEAAERVKVEACFRCVSPLSVYAVGQDGACVLLGSGTEVQYKGELVKTGEISVECKRGATVYYYCVTSPFRNWFERVDQRPVSIQRDSAVPASIRSVVREALAAILAERGIDQALADEIAEDVEANFDFEDSEPFEEFGPGHELQEDDPVGLLEEPVEPAAAPPPSPPPAPDAEPST